MKNKKFLSKFFPNFISDKKRVIKQTQDIEVEPGAQTEEIMEEEVIGSKKYIFVFYILVFVVVMTLFLKLFYLQIVFGQMNKQKAEGNRLRIRISEAPRGIIYDKNKNPLVKNVASYSIEIFPTDLPTKEQDRVALYNKLSSILNIPVSEIERVEGKKSYDQPVPLKENLTQEEAILLESKIIDLPATKVIRRPSREYLDVQSAIAHILGYTGKITESEFAKNPQYALSDSIGKSGIEKSYESYLKGGDGKQSVEVDSTGRVDRILAQADPKPGDSLILSIDSGLQDAMAKSLSSMMQNLKLDKATAIAANPKTGEILGLVSFPSYDNNLFARGIEQKDYQNLLNDPNKPMFNRAISGTYPPGSTIKPVVASAGLSEGVINKNTTINDPGIISIANQYNPSVSYNFPDWKSGGHGIVNVVKALEQSCDIFFYAVGGGWQNISGLGSDKLSSWFSKFGLGKKTGIDLSGEYDGFVPTADWKEKVKKEAWYQGDSYHVAIGQGDLLATPLQLLDYTEYFANGGTIYKPHLVSEIQTFDGHTVKKIEPEVLAKDLISKDNLDIVREGMNKVITDGTARSLSSLPFSSAGKTGTAQNPHGEPHALFISFAPYEDPQIATVVLIENGGEGSSVAVPVTRDILQYWWDNIKSKD